MNYNQFKNWLDALESANPNHRHVIKIIDDLKKVLTEPYDDAETGTLFKIQKYLSSLYLQQGISYPHGALNTMQVFIELERSKDVFKNSYPATFPSKEPLKSSDLLNEAEGAKVIHHEPARQEFRKR
ncbi:hypothetical protein ACQUW5_03770 [Legionella sp. CNM-1927-20]|uniref:hypothetical protein n=1 Tax=Legionella sp. CNM-1927-20 TaxID=3422221 RepID=UPI00403AA585